MNEIVDKLLTIEIETADERGNYELFALFLREDADNRWDLVVSADWLRQNKKRESLNYLSNKLRERLDLGQLSIITRIIILDENSSSLLKSTFPISVAHSSVLIANCTFNGLVIKHAYFLSCNPSIAA
ncbi:hypothetical protein [Spirosoma pulveris]